MNAENGAESFAIHLDNSSLERQAEEAARLIEGIGQKAVEEARRIDKALDELPRKIEEQEKTVQELTDKYDDQKNAIDNLDKQLLEHKELLELNRKEVEQTQQAYDKAKESKGEWADSTKKLKEELDNAKEGVKAEQQAIRDLNLERQQERQTLNEINQERQKEKKTLDDLQNEYKKTAKEGKDLGRTLTDAVKKHEAELKKIPSLQQQISDSMKTVGKLSAGYLTIDAAKKFISKSIEVRKELEMTERQFEGLFGAQAGGELLGGLKDISLGSGVYKLGGLAQAVETLNVYGEKTEDILPLVREFGDIAMGNEQKMNALATAIGRLNTQGNLNNLTLRTMIRAGFNPLDEMARTTGKSMEQLNAEMKAGMITTQMVKDAMKSATSEGGKYHNMMDRLSDSIAGEQTRLSTMIAGVYAKWGEEHEELIKGGYKVAQTLVQNYDTIGKTIAVLITTYGAYRAALITTAAVESAVNAHYVTKIRLLRAAAVAQAALNRVMMMNPYVLAATALTGLVAATVAFSKAADVAGAESKRLKDRLEDQKKAESELKDEVNKNTDAIKDDTKSEGERQEALDNLKRLLPSVFEKYKTWAELQRDLANATREANEEIARQNNVTLGQNVKNDRNMIADLKRYRDILKTDLPASSNAKAERLKLIKKYPQLFGIDPNNETYKKRPDLFLGANFSGQGTFQTDWNFINKKIESVTESVKGLNEELIRKNGVNWDNKLGKKTLQQTNDEIQKYQSLLKKLDKQQSPENLVAVWKKEGGRSTFGMTTQDKNRIKQELSTVMDGTEELTREELERRIGRLRQHTSEVNARQTKDFLKDAKETYEKELKKEKQIIADRNKKDKDGNFIYSSEAEYQEALRKQREAIERAKKNYENSGGNVKKDTKAGRDAERERKAREEADEKKEQERLRYEQELAKKRAAGELLQAQAVIDAMDEGEEKKLAQLELNHQMELAQIEQEAKEMYAAKVAHEKALWDAEPNNKGKDFYKAHPYDEKTGLFQGIGGLTQKDLDEAGITAKMKSVTSKFKQERDQIIDESRQMMLDYLKEYGNLQEKKAAIAAEYERKISKSQNEWERKRLRAEQSRQEAEIDMQALQNSIDWEVVFGNLDRMSKRALDDLKTKLRKALDMKDVTPENAKVLSEKILEIEDKISVRTNVWASMIPALKERERLARQTALAEEKAAKAAEQQSSAMADLAMKQLNAQDVIKRYTGKDIDTKQLSQTKEQIIADLKLDKDSEGYKKVTEALDKLAASAQKAATATNALAEARKTSESWKEIFGGSNFFKNMGSIFSDAAEKGGGGFWGTAGVINDNLQSLKEFNDKIGLAGTDFGNAVEGFCEGTNGFMNAVQSLASGNIIGAVNGVLDGIAGFGRGLTTLIAGGGNEDEMEEEIAALSKSQQVLAQSINKLADRIKQGDTTNAQSLEAYRKAMAAEEEWEEKQRQKIDDRASEWTNTGYGFLGLGGKSSFNDHMPWNLWEGWQRFSEILKENLGAVGVTHDSVNNNNIWDLSPEEMSLLREFAPKEWEALFNGDGHRNPIDLVNEYIDRAGKLSELTSALNEKLTGYDWNGFLNSYKSILKDMKSETKDFANHINEVISNALIESFVNEELKGDIDSLYNYIAEAAKDGINKQEQAEIDRMNDEIAKRSIAWRQSMIDAGMIRPESDNYNQNASRNSLSGMTQEQGEELNGRFTAVQLAIYQIADQIQQQAMNVQSIASNTSGIHSMMSDLMDMQSEAVDHLAKIEKNTNELPIIRQDIAKIKTNTSALTTKK